MGTSYKSGASTERGEAASRRGLLCKLAMPCLSSGVVFEGIRKVELLQGGHASPVKWCLKEKILLGKWSAIAMLELQRVRFAGWALIEGQHRPKAGKKKKTRLLGGH